MSPVERAAVALAERFPGQLDALAMARRGAFRRAVTGALALFGGNERRVASEVAALGPLNGCTNPAGVIVSRLRELPELVADRDRISGELCEERRWAQVDRAARRGETLRALVDRGDLHLDEATHLISRELPDADLHAIALAALESGGRA